jgi:uncharacterized C2H2 Zn-finger protein
MEKPMSQSSTLMMMMMTTTTMMTETDTEHACTQCGATFLQRKHLNEHVKRQHGDASSCTCPHCAKVFSSTSSLPQPSRGAHSGQRTFLCALSPQAQCWSAPLTAVPRPRLANSLSLWWRTTSLSSGVPSWWQVHLLICHMCSTTLRAHPVSSMTVAVSEISNVNQTSVLLLVQNGKHMGISKLEDKPLRAHPPIPGSPWNLQQFQAKSRQSLEC